MKTAIIGATGLVGRKIIKVLEERNFPVSELIPAASSRSVGTKIEFNANTYEVFSIQQALDAKPDIALFSAGAGVSLEWAKKFAEAGSYVIDNSSAWRMDPSIPLVIPEVNAEVLTKESRLIANPNCSTIQMLVALAPLHRLYGIKKIVVSTYQSVSGSGIKAIEQLENESKGIETEKVYAHQINRNCLPHCDSFLENGYTKEEMKLVNETHKILNAPQIEVSPTAVRVPVTAAHSESIWVEFEKDFEISGVFDAFSKAEGVILQDDVQNNIYPLPINAADKDEVFVGRIRKDLFNPKALSLWVVADNLRKGAATNAVQIAECIQNINLMITN